MDKIIAVLHFKIAAIFSFCIIAAVFSACVLQKTNHKFCGVLTPNFRIYDSVQKKYIMANNEREPLIYYRDSLFVGEILINYTRSTNDKLDTTYIETNFYEFTDLKTNIQINFKTFTDTATPIKIVKLTTKADLTAVWKFYGYGEPINPYSSATILTDTVMDGTNYKRVLTYKTYKNSNKTDTSFAIFYAHCKATHSMFQFDINLSKKFANGCPIQMADFYQTDNPMKLRLKYDFTRNNLSTQEHKVFDAWEKYAKEHPAK